MRGGSLASNLVMSKCRGGAYKAGHMKMFTKGGKRKTRRTKKFTKNKKKSSRRKKKSSKSKKKSRRKSNKNMKVGGANNVQKYQRLIESSKILFQQFDNDIIIQNFMNLLDLVGNRIIDLTESNETNDFFTTMKTAFNYYNNNFYGFNIQHLFYFYIYIRLYNIYKIQSENLESQTDEVYINPVDRINMKNKEELTTSNYKKVKNYLTQERPSIFDLIETFIEKTDETPLIIIDKIFEDANWKEYRSPLYNYFVKT